jgi:hypothetical protein
MRKMRIVANGRGNSPVHLLCLSIVDSRPLGRCEGGAKEDEGEGRMKPTDNIRLWPIPPK